LLRHDPFSASSILLLFAFRGPHRAAGLNPPLVSFSGFGLVAE
jgi:hypothetical protein